MNRDDMLRRALERREPWDMVIIGGGATGMGSAVDAASRGYQVLLLEQHDFGKATSSRSTKLIHGGVRYLRQGNLSLVRETLEERAILRRNAPHLVRDRAFIVPSYRWYERSYYALGLKAYDLLARGDSFGPSRPLSVGEVRERLPTIKAEGLRGGVLYHDGQFDDARLLIHLARTAADHGAVLLNYAKVVGLTQGGDGAINGVEAIDEESGQALPIPARVVINATGVFVDAVRHMVEPKASALVAPSQGAHLVLDRSFLPGDTALLVPQTRDGRVLFVIPWHDHVLVGTTDVAIQNAPLEPRATESEIDFILETARGYLDKRPTRSDILCTFAGVRPLVRAGDKKTAALARDHTIQVGSSGLVTITGGKWTTYRKMAEDVIDHAIQVARRPPRPCVTRTLPLHGAYSGLPDLVHLTVHGSDVPAMVQLAMEDPPLMRCLHAALPYTAAEVVWSVRFEMARTVEDVLARRMRALFLNTRAAIEMAPEVAGLMAAELGRSAAWQATQVQSFQELAAGYLPTNR
jgi:glycerol-3-phosphate dehydrogenase